MSSAATIDRMELLSETKRAFLSRSLMLLRKVSQKSAGRAQKFFEQLKPVLLAAGAAGVKGEQAVEIYDPILQIADRLSRKSDYLAIDFLAIAAELTRLKQDQPVARWTELFEAITGSRDKEPGETALVRETSTYAAKVKEVLAELAELASREGDERIIDVVLDNVLKVASKDADAAFRCLTATPMVLRRMRLEDYPQWVERGLRLAASNQKSLEAYFGYESNLSHESAESETGAVTLEEVLPVLRHYIEGMTGKPFTVAASKDIPPLTGIYDGKTIRLPAIVKSFERREDNFRLYKALAARAAGQLEFGTYDENTDELAQLKEQLESEFRRRGGHPVPHGPVTAKRLLAIFPQNNLAAALFAILEEARIEHRLCQSYHGLRRDLEWTRSLREYRRPDNVYLMGYEPVLEIIFNALLTNPSVETRDDEEQALLELVNEIKERFIARSAQASSQATVADSLQATLRVYEHLAPKPPEDSNVPWDEKEVPREQEGDQMKIVPPEPIEDSPSKDKISGVQVNRIPAKSDSAAEVKAVIESNQPAVEPPAEPDVFYYPEWDYGLGDYCVNWCRVREYEGPRADASFVKRTRARYRGLLSSISHQFQMLRPQGLRRIGGQVDGDDFDMQAVLDHVVDHRAKSSSSERIYTQRLKQERDVAVMFLVDMSGSTSHVIDNQTQRKIIDIEKEALVMMAEALEAVGDSYAIYGFSSHGRKKISLYKVKGFDEQINSSVERRIAGIKPLVNTRLGAAIRHATMRLAAEAHQTRLLIIISDGKPSDDDGYELPRYGQEDTRHALIESRRQAVTPFCITVDSKEEEDLKKMYGEVGYTIVDDVLELPERLPNIYRRLTT